MKKTTILFLLLNYFFGFSQSPQGISYQSIAYDSSGVLVVSGNVGVKISILNLTDTGTVVYSETHLAAPNNQGLYSLTIGQGNVVSGVFSTINWGVGNKFLKIELDPQGGTNYTANGVSQFLSVPYAFFAGKVSGAPFVDWVNIWDYANGQTIDDGLIDAAPALNAALATGKTVYIPNPNDLTKGYAIKSSINIPTNGKIVGANKQTTKLINNVPGAGNMFYLNDNVQLDNLYLEGNGIAYTGKGLVMYTPTNLAAGKQLVSNCKITNFSSACVFFGKDAGSQCFFVNIEVARNNAVSGSGKYAIEIESTQQLSAIPRKFNNIESQGTPTFNFGGCNNVYITNSFLADLLYTQDSRAVLISNSRIANATSMLINGHNNTITGCDINPQVTIVNGADNISISSNSYNSPPVIDLSGNGRNSIVLNSTITYLPTLSTTGVQPLLGNGVLRGEWTRSGVLITLTIELTMGSTTNLGSGDLRFSIPNEIISRNTLIDAQYGTGVCYSSSGNAIIVSVLGTNTNYLTGLTSDTGYNIKNGIPFPKATGNVIRLSIIYSL